MKITRITYPNYKTSGLTRNASKEQNIEAKKQEEPTKDGAEHVLFADTYLAPFLVDEKRRKITSEINLKQGQRCSVKLDDEIIEKYLLDFKGNIDYERAAEFITIYSFVAQELRDKEDKLIEFYKSNLPSCNDKIVSFPFFEEDVDFEELEKIKDDDEYVKAVISYLTGDRKEEVVQDLIKFTNEVSIPEINENALIKTMRIFDLSRGEYGTYDFSHIKEKSELADSIDVIEYNFGWDSTFEVSKCLMEYGDFEFVKDVCEVVLAGDCFVSPVIIAPVLREFYSKDESHKEEILDSIIQIKEAGFDDVETLLGFCFDKDGFDNKAFGALYKMLSLSNDLIEKRQNKMSEDVLIQKAMWVIKGYFDQTKDKSTGKFDPSDIDLDEFFKTEIGRNIFPMPDFL